MSNLIPNDIFLGSLLAPTFTLNRDQQALNKLTMEQPVVTLRMVKKRNMGMSTFFALMSVWQARLKQETIIIVPQGSMVKGMHAMIRRFYPEYTPMNNSGIQVIAGYSLTNIKGRNLDRTTVILDELPFTESSEVSEFIVNLMPHHPRKLIMATSVSKSIYSMFGLSDVERAEDAYLFTYNPPGFVVINNN